MNKTTTEKRMMTMMKHPGWIVAALLLFAVIMSQITIAVKSAKIEDLERACAIYHRKLTGEPHPFYAE